MSETHIHYLVDAQGACAGVQLSPLLWENIRHHALEAERRLIGGGDPFEKPQPMEALHELKQYWDFKYPYDPQVRCPGCNGATGDWENDPAHPFHLTNANFGGLLVFLCRQCGATVRKKHFRDKVVFEHTPKP